ncbi:methyl-accepting chemotaxis protein, partial [Erwinia amylovora]|nr:methyl-accepting chemotaxis protein [Erwinia amylovora]
NPLMAAVQKQNSGDYYAIMEGNLSSLSGKYSDAVDNFGRYANVVTASRLDQAAYNQSMMSILILVSGALTLLLVAAAWMILRE